MALKNAEYTLPDIWAGLVTFGDINIQASELKNKGIELPVWMFMSKMDKEVELIDLFKNLNHCLDERFSNDYADGIFFPNQQTNDLLLNSQPMSQVRYTITKDASSLVPTRASSVYEFLSLGTREVAYGNKSMRYTHDLEDWGATIKSISIGGITRKWMEYVPVHLRNTNDGDVPLVVALHGSALSGSYLAERTSWIKLAEEFGFIIVMPDGSIGKGIAPVWNWLRDPLQWDDVSFIDKMVEDVSDRLPVDVSRRYLYGHSMGGMFMQVLVGYLDGKFAAASGTGCAFASIPKIELKQKTPVFVLFGEKDMGNPSIETGAGPRKFIELFTEYNNCGGIDDLDGSYRFGRYRLYTWEDKNNVPMVQYGIVDDKPHTVTLDEGIVLYNWMSQFNRNDDGTVGYRTGIYNNK